MVHRPRVLLLLLLTLACCCFGLAAGATAAVPIEEWKLQWGSPVKAVFYRRVSDTFGAHRWLVWNLTNHANATFGNQIVHPRFRYPKPLWINVLAPNDHMLVPTLDEKLSSVVVGRWCAKYNENNLGNEACDGLDIRGYVPNDDEVIIVDLASEKLTAQRVLERVKTTIFEPVADESWGSYIGRLIVVSGMVICTVFALYFYIAKGTAILPDTPAARDYHNRVYGNKKSKRVVK